MPMLVDVDLNFVWNGVKTTSFIGAVTQMGVKFMGMSVSVKAVIVNPHSPGHKRLIAFLLAPTTRLS